MTEFGDEVVAFALDLMRSLWAELGVEAPTRRHDAQALDLEPLIVFTAAFADGRLRARAIDWCAINRRYLSTIRLNHFSWRFGEPARRAYESFASDTEDGAKARPGSAPRISVTPDLRRPSLIQLRLRAVAGVGARAEVLKLLLSNPSEPRSAASLVGPAGYGKGGLAQALDLLTVAGITSSAIDRRKTVYRLNRPAELERALSGLPAAFPDWAAVFMVIGAILRYAKQDSAGARRVAAAAATAHAIREECARIPGIASPPRVTDEASVAGFERWATALLADQAAATAGPGRQREVSYTVHRLRLGGWISTVREEGYQPRPLALSDDPELRPERRAQRRLKPDEIGAAAEVVESMFVDIHTRELQRRQGSVLRRQSADALLPALSREFATELLKPMQKGQAATFTEDFLQRWSAGHRAKSTAAG